MKNGRSTAYNNIILCIVSISCTIFAQNEQNFTPKQPICVGSLATIKNAAVSPGIRHFLQSLVIKQGVEQFKKVIPLLLPVLVTSV